MIEITKDQCTKMLVLDNNEDNAKELLVFVKIEWGEYPYKALLNNGAIASFRHAKPLPEPKTMTSLDAMWWAGIRKVWRTVGTEIFWCVSTFCSDNSLEEREWNELTRIDGKTTLLYDEWKEFNFENCEMEE